MSHSPSFAGIILAAGESSRMGTDKALLPWPPSSAVKPGSETFLSAAIRSLSASSDFVLVVVGRNEASVSPVVYANGASITINPNPERGQFSSLQVGLREVLNRGRDTAMVTLVDRPPASAATIQALCAAYESADHRIWAVVPEFSGRHGHPFIVGREMIEAFLHAPHTATARDIEHTHQDRILYMAVNDPLVAANVNTPEDYATLFAPSPGTV